MCVRGGWDPAWHHTVHEMAGLELRAIMLCCAGLHPSQLCMSDPSPLHKFPVIVAVGVEWDVHPLPFHVVSEGGLALLSVVLGGYPESLAYSLGDTLLGTQAFCWRWLQSCGPDLPKGAAALPVTCKQLLLLQPAEKHALPLLWPPFPSVSF